MSASQKTYTIDQIAIAARELREAAGADPERYTGAEVATLLSAEIDILRQRGFSDELIAGLMTGFEIDIHPSQLDRRSRTPFNLLRRLLWGRLQRRVPPYRLQTD